MPTTIKKLKFIKKLTSTKMPPKKDKIKQQNVFPLTRPPNYEEPKSSRNFSITLRPHDKHRFTNEAEEREKITKYAQGLDGYISIVIGKEWNQKRLYETNGNEPPKRKYMKKTQCYHYHIMLKTNIPAKESKKTTLQQGFMKLFPDNLINEVSTKVKFLNSKSRDALIYTIKEGDYTFSSNDGSITNEYINNSIEIYLKDNPIPRDTKTYHATQLTGVVFDHLLEFCKEKNIKHCNYNEPQIDEFDMMTCDNVELFVIDNKKFVGIDYLAKFFRRETGNLNGDGVKKFNEFKDHISSELEQFEQTTVSKRYTAYDDGKIIIDGRGPRVLSAEEADEVLSTYTPLITFKENPHENFKPPLLFYSLLNKTKMKDDIMDMLRYYLTDNDDHNIKVYQLLGEGNTGKSSVMKYITFSYGPHCKKITKEGKFTFSEARDTYLRWSDELNVYALYDDPDISEIMLALMEKQPVDTPVKHQNKGKLMPSLMLFATNPERYNSSHTAIKNNYNSVKYGPVNKRTIQLSLTEVIEGGKVNNDPVIEAELPHTTYAIIMNLPIPDNSQEEDQR